MVSGVTEAEAAIADCLAGARETWTEQIDYLDGLVTRLERTQDAYIAGVVAYGVGTTALVAGAFAAGLVTIGGPTAVIGSAAGQAGIGVSVPGAGIVIVGAGPAASIGGTLVTFGFGSLGAALVAIAGVAGAGIAALRDQIS